MGATSMSFKVRRDGESFGNRKLGPLALTVGSFHVIGGTAISGIAQFFSCT